MNEIIRFCKEYHSVILFVLVSFLTIMMSVCATLLLTQLQAVGVVVFAVCAQVVLGTWFQKRSSWKNTLRIQRLWTAYFVVLVLLVGFCAYLKANVDVIAVCAFIATGRLIYTDERVR